MTLFWICFYWPKLSLGPELTPVLQRLKLSPHIHPHFRKTNVPTRQIYWLFVPVELWHWGLRTQDHEEWSLLTTLLSVIGTRQKLHYAQLNGCANMPSSINWDVRMCYSRDACPPWVKRSKGVKTERLTTTLHWKHESLHFVCVAKVDALVTILHCEGNIKLQPPTTSNILKNQKTNY